MNLRPFRSVHLLRAVCVLLLATAMGVPAAQAQDGFGAPPQQLAPDTGVASLRQALRRLQTTARLMETTAHPDDEDGGMLTLESRGRGVTALSFTLTRGEGGQNKTGSNLFDLLGILRTLEVLASDRYYGVEQRFSHVADFGFSKTAAETLEKWNGGEPALADMVRVIRQFRPDVIVSRFQGTPRDGHGHHQASGLLTREAFRAAADPTKFPEQIREGLQPWQAKKLYVGIFRRTTEPYTVALDTGVNDPLLGTSFAQFALEGLKHQESQGVGSFTLPPGPHLTYYRLVDSTLPGFAPGAHEVDFFDGIDTSLPAVAARLGNEESKAPFLRPALVEIEKDVTEATRAADGSDPSQAAAPLLRAMSIGQACLQRLKTSSLSLAAIQEATTMIGTKQVQLRRTLDLALGLSLQAVVELPRDSHASDAEPFMAVPGGAVNVAVTFANHGMKPVKVHGIGFQGFQFGSEALEGEYKDVFRIVPPGGEVKSEWHLRVPANATATRPLEHRDDPERDSVYIVDGPPRFQTWALAPPPLLATADYELPGQSFCTPAGQHKVCATGYVEVPVEVRYANQDATVEHPLAIGPDFSVRLEPGTQVIAIPKDGSTEVAVHVHCNVQRAAAGNVKLELPSGWRAEPSAAPVKFDGSASDQTVNFKVSPGQLAEKTYTLKAVLQSGGKQYTEGYTVVTRPDLGEFFYYHPASQKISAVDLKLPAALTVGYIMGAGDDIPTVLQQAGVEVHEITPPELATGDLRRYGTIVLGIRAYDVRDDVRAQNQRLLDYVKAGGTLLVQYNANVTQFNDGHYAPYPLQLSRERVTVEEAPVEVLAPQDGIFHAPNPISARDFDGWVQERGLYFADQWDEHYQPLLASHDPGEQPLKGGLLRARYGKGTYIYTGYAFFRQLPAGVPGAVRLFLNLISAGHEAR